MTALLVIDVQKEYMRKYDGSLLDAVNRRIDEAAERDDLVVYVKNVRKLKGGDVVYDFADGLSVRSSNIILKGRSSVFQDGALLELLHKRNVSEIVIIGIDGNCCVASSAIDARKLGYAVTLPCAGIGVQNPERFEKRKKQLEKLGVRVIADA